MTSDSDKEGMLQRKNDLDEGGRKVSCVLMYIIIYTYIPYSIHHLYLTNLLLPIIYVTFSGSLLFLHTRVCNLKIVYEANKFIVESVIYMYAHTWQNNF